MKIKFLPSITLVVILTQCCFLQAQNWSLTGNTGTKPKKDFLGTIDDKTLIFRTNNIERMRIDKTGNVGIGITKPGAPLNIAGNNLTDLSAPGTMIIGNQTGTNMAFDYQQIQARYIDQGGTLFLNHLGGAVSIGSYSGQVFPAIWTNSDGRVGIGTNYALATGYALTVEPSLTGNGIYVNDPGNGYSLYTVKTGNYGPAIHVEANYAYDYVVEVFSTSSKSSLYGESYGNGNGVEGNTVGGYGVVGDATNNVGVLGIGGAYAGYFDGDVYASGTYLGSDQKLKQNINDFSDAMKIIGQLQPKHYEYKHDSDYQFMNLPEGGHYGLIAQDVEKVLPNLIKDAKFETHYAHPHASEEDEKNAAVINFKALNYTELIPIIIKGMQEMEAINNEQQLKLEEQQKQIEALSTMINALTNNKSAVSNPTGAYLQQNTSNPFSENTIIGYYVPSSANQAQLIVCSVDGKLLKSYDLNIGNNEITIHEGALPSGEYVYSLIIDGKKVDSKYMNLTR